MHRLLIWPVVAMALLGSAGAAPAAEGNCYRMKYGAEERSNWTLREVAIAGLSWWRDGETITFETMGTGTGIPGRSADGSDGSYYRYFSPADHILVFDGDVYELGCEP